jgi:hypothetical protein
LAACSIAGPIVVLLLSHQGVHSTNDSFTYLGAGSSLADGKGWTYPFGQVGAPVTLFPPLYPLLLAVPKLLGIDPLHWTLWQNAALSFALSMVVGRSVFWSTNGNLLAAVAAVGLVLLGKPTSVYYAQVWSETLFLPLVILALWWMARYLRSRGTRELIICGAFSSLAMLTRYAGLPLFVTCLLILAAWPGRRVVARARSLAVYGGVALALNIAWSIRNLVESRTLTGNNHLVHHLSMSQVDSGFRVILTWFAPRPFPGWFGLQLVTLVGGVVLGGLLIFRRRRGEVASRVIRIPPFATVCLVFAILYFVFIMAANAFSTRAPPFTDRILGPIFIPLAISFVLVVDAVWQLSGGLPIVRCVATATALALIAVVGVQAGSFMRVRFGSPVNSAVFLGDLSRALRGSDTGERLVLSNHSNFAWYTLGRPVENLPASCTGERPPSSDPRYPSEMRALAQGLDGNPRLVLIFLKWNGCPPFSVSEVQADLDVVQRTVVARRVVLLQGP